MRNLGKLAFQRVVLVSLGILLQLAVMLLFMTKMAAGRQWFDLLMMFLRVFFVVYLVSSRTNPSYKIAWIILILALPVAGVSIYLFLGGNRLSRREKRKMSSLTLMVEKNLQDDEETSRTLSASDPGAALQSAYLKHHALSPVYAGTKTEYFPCGEACFPRMLEDLKQAKKYIFLEYFILENGEMWQRILDILTEKASQGVDVRLIYDDFGCITRLPSGYAKKLGQLGIRAQVFNPFVPVVSGRLNNRDHRKLMIVDGTVGYTGGMNLADEYINRNSRFGYWKDAGLRLEGPGVWSMTVQFLSMWNYISGKEEDLQGYRAQVTGGVGGGYVQPFSDSPLDSEGVGETVILNMISRAKRSVYIMTPYLILDDKMTTALCNAAKMGLDVRIVTPGIPDKWYVYAVTRANYPALTEAGVRIFEFTPGFLHSKVFCVDGKTALVGTVNLDFRSLYLHFENGVWMHEADCISAISEDFEKTFAVCREITHRMTTKVPVPVRIFRSLLHLFAPLM